MDEAKYYKYKLPFRHIYDWFGKNANLKTEDNKLYAYIKTDDRAFKNWALQYSEEFKVIEPKYLKDQLLEHAKAMLKIMRDSCYPSFFIYSKYFNESLKYQNFFYFIIRDIVIIFI